MGVSSIASRLLAKDQQVVAAKLTAGTSKRKATPGLASGSTGGQRPLQGSDRLPLAVEITLSVRQAKYQGARELILPPLIFPVQVGRTL